VLPPSGKTPLGNPRLLHPENPPRPSRLKSWPYSRSAGPSRPTGKFTWLRPWSDGIGIPITQPWPAMNDKGQWQTGSGRPATGHPSDKVRSGHGLGVQVVKSNQASPLDGSAIHSLKRRLAASPQVAAAALATREFGWQQTPIPTGATDGLVADLEPILHVITTCPALLNQINPRCCVQRLAVLRFAWTLVEAAASLTPDNQVNRRPPESFRPGTPIGPGLQLVHAQLIPDRSNGARARIVEAQSNRSMAQD